MLFGEVKSTVSQFRFSERFSEFLIHLHEQSPQALWSMGITRIQGWIHWGFQLKQNAPCMVDAESIISQTWTWLCSRGSAQGGHVDSCAVRCFDLLFSPNWCMLSYGHSKGDATNQEGTFQLLPSLGGCSVGAQLGVLVGWHAGDCCAGREEVTVLHCLLLCFVGSCWPMVRQRRRWWCQGSRETSRLQQGPHMGCCISL